MELQPRMDPCSHCGACMSFCVWDAALRTGRPAGPDLCRDCQVCYRICPRLPHDSNALATTLFPSAKSTAWGHALATYTGRASHRPAYVQDGGMATALATFLLERGEAEAVLVTGRDEDWQPHPFWATDAANVLKASGSKYSTAPALSILGQANGRYQRMASIVLPCQAAALARLRQAEPAWKGRITLVIGLFCSKTFVHRADSTGLMDFIEQKTGHSAREIERFDIRRGRLIARRAEETAEWRIKEFSEAAWPICAACQDLSAEFADISLGSIGSSEGNCTVIVRSERGAAILDAGQKAGLWELAPLENTESLEKLSAGKRNNPEMLSEDQRKLYGRSSVRGNWHRRVHKSSTFGQAT